MTLPPNPHTHTLDGYGCVIQRNKYRCDGYGNRCDGYGCPKSKIVTTYIYNIYDTYCGSGLKHAIITP